MSVSNKAPHFLKALILRDSSCNNDLEKFVDSTLELDTFTEVGAQDDCYESAGILGSWATTLKAGVEYILSKEEGDDINPRLCPEFASRLLKEMKTFPLWSSIS